MISKSDYIKFVNCPKLYWMFHHKNELAKPIDDQAQKHIDDGVKVGQIAKEFFPDTFDAQRKNSVGKLDYDAQVFATNIALKGGSNCIAEAAFIHEDLFCAVDLLKKDDENSYSIYEVKATNELKDDHFPDIAFQKYVLEQCGLKINHLYILHLNHKYCRNGKIDPTALLIPECVDVHPEVTTALTMLNEHLDMMRRINKEKNEFTYSLGAYCKDCPFHEYCHKDIPNPSVLNINGIRKSKAYDLINDGVITYLDFTKTGDSHLNTRQKLQIEGFLKNREVSIDQEKLRSFLKSLSYPIYHLDFETMNEAIPPVDGAHSYDQIPFQYSLHIEKSPGGELEHREFLGDRLDCQRALAEQLCNDIPKGVTSMAYNMTFEKTVLKHLAESYPDLAEHLLDIRENMVDLLVPFKQGYYYNIKQGGSNSIKYVMPALCPEMAESYHELPVVHNGGEALAMFPKLVLMEGEEYQRVRSGMLSYCCLDTLSMVKVLNKLWEDLK